VIGAGEEVGVHSDRVGAVDVDLAVVDEPRLGRADPEAVEGEIVDGRLSLSNFSSPETTMPRKRRKKASSLTRNGLQKPAEKLVMAKR
jgi:hypothetical protein